MALPSSARSANRAPAAEHEPAAGACARCGRQVRSVAYSHRLGERVCWDCYHGSFAPGELAEAERIETQRGIARAIRAAAEPLRGSARHRRLAERALLIELETSTAGVLALLEEVAELGVDVEMRSP